MVRFLTATLLALAFALPVARAEEPVYLLVHDASALIGADPVVVEESIRAEIPADERMAWLATWIQARQEQRVLSGRGPEREGEPAVLTVAELARWIEINTRELAGPTTIVRPAARGICVVGTAALHAKVALLLDRLRAAAWACHHFEVTLVSYTPEFLARVNPQAMARFGDGRVPGFRLAPEEAAAFLSGLAAGGHVVDRGQGILSMAWGEEARFSLVREVTHAAAVETHIAFGRVFGVPRPGTVEDGLWIRGRVGDPQGDAVALQLDLETALLTGLDAFTVPSGTIEIPSILRRPLALAERLKNGEGIGILGLDDPFALSRSPRGKRSTGTDTNLLVFVRYLGKQAPPPAALSKDAENRLAREPGRALVQPADTDLRKYEFYDVTDIALQSAQDFSATLHRSRNGGLEPGTEKKAGPAAIVEEDGTQHMADLIRSCVMPQFWPANSESTVQVKGHGMITVNAPESVQGLIRVFLEDLRTIESSLLTVRVHVFAGRRKPGTPRMAILLPSLAQDPSLEPEQIAHKVEEMFQKDASLRVITAPVLSTFQGQLASILVANQVAFLQDHTLSEGGSGAILDPVVGTLQEGVLLQVRAQSILDGEWIRIAGSLEVSGLEKPMQNHAFGVPADAGRDEASVDLNLPTTRRLIYAFTEVVPRREALMLSLPGYVDNVFGRTPSGKDAREELYLMIRASTSDLRKPPVTGGEEKKGLK